jgi:hypothetical protein
MTKWILQVQLNDKNLFFGKGALVHVVYMVLFFGLFTLDAKAQSFFSKLLQKKDTIDYNTAYIKSYTDKFTTRIFYSQNYTNLTLRNELEDFELNFEPNTNLNLGIGATVNSVTLNLSYGFKFLNPEEKSGSTKYLDLQNHIYSRKWVIDIFAQFYQGLYLDNVRELVPDYQEDYYVRSDIYQQLLGASALYLFNNRKFSYSAPFNQNERQLKSAGSFLLGGEASWGLADADSALVPTFDYPFDVSKVDSISSLAFYRIGPSVGYVYSLVIAKKVFATLSFTLNTSYGLNVVHHDTRGRFKNDHLNAGVIIRFALGYNDDRWFLGINTVNALVSSSNKDRSLTSDFGIGNARLTFAWRINPGPKLQKVMNFLP